ncbi:Hydantoinase B/oxoprolinase-domain-containing protein [Microdochium trichocladiopsis]|uniref:Hydantoinase B/oxoprolinase-domain-containing protein n=1 Tax=Microdochium trichocladiopsis TaxID=1682393 RepID=A0A9P8Y4I2_9PEZI|nr:Hydantoinase B/oxoprolinase-domain-containing protein [Microdochium trichocladiopsis]KAH7029536.1 Hydantoinase B/oxoprolinase-domain-containing protein [Microdochium trichocladiopsis]
MESTPMQNDTVGDPKLSIKIAIDRGGTFTDCLGIVQGREQDILVKILSQDPANYADAPREGIRRILELATGKSFSRSEPIDTSQFQELSIRMGTTVATNALLERKGERVALLITEGFAESLKIGLQSRPKLFDLNIVKPDVLYETVVEVSERVTPEGYQQSPTYDDDMLQIERAAERDPDLVRGLNGQIIRVLKKIDTVKVKADLEKLYTDGFRSICVCLVHSYTFLEHELEIQKIASEIGFTQITLSCLTLPMIKMINRGMSATADTYLTPVVQQYIKGFQSGFKDGLKSSNTRCEFMQSDGGLVDVRKFSGLRAVLSGPAGGVVGYARTSFHPEENVPVIGFDMGGTSTDVSRFDGSFEHTFENSTAGISIMAPQLDINTVAAGGGSILHWRHGLFAVGPDSAGAHPGPACYRKGGPLAISDANAFTGRLIPDYFPKIFGKRENEPLDVEITRQKFTELAKQISAETGQTKTPEEVAMGFIEVANETMAKPIRALTEARGFDTSSHHLACFGGAGGQHACAIATSLSIRRVIVHRYSLVLSAYGMALADTVHEAQRPASGAFKSTESVQPIIDELKAEVTKELLTDGVTKDRITHEVYLNLRYQGTDNSIMVLEPAGGDYLAEFTRQHFREYSFTFPDKQVLLEDIRVRGIGQSLDAVNESPYEELRSVKTSDVAAGAEDRKSAVYFTQSGWVDTPVYCLETLTPGSIIHGPAIIIDKTQTIVVEPRVKATILSCHVILDLQSSQARELSETKIDPISLSIFGHRFMSIAEQMGRTFQKTAVSTNIKERLDFSCAMFSPEGRLVANAPHVPVHLGSMEYAVRFQNQHYRSTLKPGDVLCSNHPVAGGVHLPDITVMTPVWDEAGENIIFWVASRGHHSDVGGISPGSMPSNSRFLYEEGAAAVSYKLVSNGKFNEEETRNFLYDEPSQYEGCSGSRTYNDNVSDLRAAIAANRKGAQLIDVLIKEFGLPVVHAYMNAITDNAETAVKAFLRKVARTANNGRLSFEDYLDDGSVIKLEIRIDAETGLADFDFTGTSQEAFNCLNTPKAITHSAVIYSLRCLINVDIPLNQGCLAPINVIIPEGTILNPSRYAAVCAGNSITSQRVTDVILGAFKAMAASQGCVNVFAFGMGGKDASGKDVPGFGYIETIAGGHGAGPSWHGTSGVHVNMTNTRCADPEVYESRYPVILRQWTLRKGSGGRGKFNGGEGCVRDVEFRIPLSVSMLSERRVMRPYGVDGGEPGGRGVNLYVKKEADGRERIINIGGKMELKVSPGERVIINTPGGGGWGVASGGEVNGTGAIKSNGTGVAPMSTFEPRGSVHNWTMTAEGV